MIKFDINSYINELKILLDKTINQSNKILEISNVIVERLKNNSQILVCGNGGSAADAEHFAGELLCTFEKRNRIGLGAINLSSNVAALTAWSNDFNYDSFYERKVNALGSEGDILLILSTGGGNTQTKTSLNVVNAARAAKKKKIKVISLIGKTGGELKSISDHYILLESNSTSNIQEVHMAVLHIFCKIIDKAYE